MTSRRPRSTVTVLLAGLIAAAVAACVTINVYFPEAAAERAADRFIQDVIGESGDPGGQPGGRPGAAIPPSAAITGALARLGGFVIAPAQAQTADIDIENPQIETIKQRMAGRHRDKLAAWFDAGAIGLGNDGLIEIRDRSAVGLAERRELEQVVAAENADRRAVYREIAVANGHPEWEERIRQTFAERWIANARPGWYYRDEAGQWVRK